MHGVSCPDALGPMPAYKYQGTVSPYQRTLGNVRIFAAAWDADVETCFIIRKIPVKFIAQKSLQSEAI